MLSQVRRSLRIRCAVLKKPKIDPWTTKKTAKRPKKTSKKPKKTPKKPRKKKQLPVPPKPTPQTPYLSMRPLNVTKTIVRRLEIPPGAPVSSQSTILPLRSPPKPFPLLHFLLSKPSASQDQVQDQDQDQGQCYKYFRVISLPRAISSFNHEYFIDDSNSSFY